MTTYTTVTLPLGHYPTYDRRWLSNASIANETRLTPIGTDFIGGIVKDSSGASIASQPVYLYNAETGAMLAKTVSDDMGRYRFNGVSMSSKYRVYTRDIAANAEAPTGSFIQLTETDILSVVRTLLFDTAAIRWTETELRFWLNDGQRRIASQRPEASTSTRTITLSAGVKQTIPIDTWMLLDLIRNVPGSAIRLCELENLTAYAQTWPTDTADSAIMNFSYDERNPGVFYVYPPSNGASNVEAVFAVVPVPTTTGSSAISLNNTYTPALIDYILWRALSKDSGIPGGMARANIHKEAYELWMTDSARILLQFSPNKRAH